MGVRHCRQSLLLPAHPAAGDVSPSDGYQPPEDPLRGVARQIEATARLKAAFPRMVFVGSGYTYLQEWLPHVAQFNVRTGRTDFVGLGRLVLSYPDLPADVLNGAPLQRKCICRTFSDCTTGPRIGLVSGCFPLDPFYLETSGRRAAAQGQGPGRDMTDARGTRRNRCSRSSTAFLALFAIVGFALYGLPRFYPFFVQELGWTRSRSPLATPTARSPSPSRSASSPDGSSIEWDRGG